MNFNKNTRNHLKRSQATYLASQILHEMHIKNILCIRTMFKNKLYLLIFPRCKFQEDGLTGENKSAIHTNQEEFFLNTYISQILS
ncbi:MAG: hypothetical protein CMF35_16335 [Leeuwenhoekiella sp.]|uniref:Uncharacterized protein n=1 Tax=Salinimonas sediminis TaxID=2303538 RepID=A0A346NM43_9ALTE|nr:hypothetical protein D0Y50_09600 [Salinimonas sediminis]MBQ53230.1 hypothetical protein [Leeuwenhoekiella sp.]